MLRPRPAGWRALSTAFLFALASACSHAQRAQPAANPITPFARLLNGEWRMVPGPGSSMIDTWHWGPGGHSVRVMTHGFNAASGDPWREVRVFYWHPGRREVRLLGLSPFDRGVSEGTVTFAGETADGVFDIHQAHGLRKVGLHWAFDGPDKYHDTLLEDTGAGLKKMNEWDRVRSATISPMRPLSAREAGTPSEPLRVFEPVLGHTWEARGESIGGGALNIQTTFEWVPLADAIYARTVALTGSGESTHVLDAYIYHHTGTGAVRGLALSGSGGVYEGDMTILDGGGLQAELKGYEGDKVVARVVRFDFEKDGALRNRVWTLEGAGRTLLLDSHLRRLDSP